MARASTSRRSRTSFRPPPPDSLGGGDGGAASGGAGGGAVSWVIGRDYPPLRPAGRRPVTATKPQRHHRVTPSAGPRGPRRGATVRIEVVVEVPKGSRNKYEMDHETGAIWLDRELFTATRYPADYGFIPHTLAEDGDPLCVLGGH